MQWGPAAQDSLFEWNGSRQMMLSVIVTTYNRPDALRKVLKGLMHQLLMPDEVIIADDGSTEETRMAVSGIQDACPFPLRHVRQEDRGFRLARIRNKAIRAAGGRYIVMLDGDCIPDSRFVQDHLALAEEGCFFQGKRVLVQQRAAEAFTHHSIGRYRIRNLFTRGIENRHHLIAVPFFPALRSTRLSGIRGCNMGFFRKDIFKVNGYNEDFIGWGREDSELAVRFYKAGMRRKEHPFKAICYHLWHPEQHRERLTVNDALLEKALHSHSHTCTNGLMQLR